MSGHIVGPVRKWTHRRARVRSEVTLSSEVLVIDITTPPGPAAGISEPVPAGGEARLREILARSPESADIRVVSTPDLARSLPTTNLNSRLRFDLIESPVAPSTSLLGKWFGFLVLAGFVIMRESSRSGPASRVVYTPSNMLPDVLTAAVLLLLRRSRAWVAVVHHIVSPKGMAYGKSEAFVSSALNRTSTILCSLLASHVICVNSQAAREVLHMSARRNGVTINGNALNDDLVNREGDAEPPREPHQVVYFGRLARQKGVLQLISIWEKVVERLPDARLVLAGPEDTLSRETILTSARDLGIEYSISVAGLLDRGELLSLVRSCAVSVTASFVEGWSHSIMESLALGTPVVAWNIPSLREVYDESIWFVPVNRDHEFASAIVRLLTDSGLLSAYRQRGYRLVRDAPRWIEVANREWSVILETHGSAPAV